MSRRMYKTDKKCPDCCSFMFKSRIGSNQPHFWCDVCRKRKLLKPLIEI